MKRRVKPQKEKTQIRVVGTKSTIDQMIDHILAYHNNWGREFIADWSITRLLANCHPIDRKYYARRFGFLNY